MKNIPSYAWNKDFFFRATIFFDSKKRPRDSRAKKETQDHRFSPLGLYGSY
jgi:hypothetical protein